MNIQRIKLPSKHIKRAIKYFLWLLLALFIAVLGFVGYVYWKLETGKITEDLRELLAENLGTQVDLDMCKVRIFRQELVLYGLNIKDQQQQDMLHVDTLEVKVNLFDLMDNCFTLHNFNLRGAHANIYRIEGSKDFNTTFITDSLKTVPKEKSEVSEQKKHENLYIDLRKFNIKNSTIRYENAFIRLDDIVIRPAKDTLTHLAVNKILIHTDNHKPRKNQINPRRGAFDAGHVDVELSFDATASYLTTDSIAMQIDRMSLNENQSKLILKDLTTHLTMANGKCHATDLQAKLQNTSLEIPDIEITLPSKVMEREFLLSAPNLHSHAILKDLSIPFSPRLKNFTTPLEVTTNITVDKQGMKIAHIKVHTWKHQLNLSADGYIKFIDRSVHGKPTIDGTFNVHSMHANNEIKNKIVGHFAHLSPSLVTMLTQVGEVSFKGKVHIPYKHTQINGTLTTMIGNIKTDLDFNKKNHRMKGTVSSDSISLSTLTGNKDLGKVAFNANFDLDVKHRKKVPGKKQLPRGTVEGIALEASYRRMHIHNISFNINSDGEMAKGFLTTNKKVVDISADFSFQGADIKHTLKVKPHLKAHLENTFVGKLFKRGESEVEETIEQEQDTISKPKKTKRRGLFRRRKKDQESNE